uniref:Uncharacterized protein n=1 Tax=Quercus lobata TaxID=97700 RepID=A0A7N2KQU5_QUELO
MKQECPTYLKSIGKSKALAATLSDIKPEDDSDSKDDEILNAFTAIVNVEDVDEEEDLVESKFEKMDEQGDIHTAYAKLYKTIGALTFENNFLAEKTKKLEMEQFQVRAQLERTSSAKLDEMLSLQKSTSDRTGLGNLDSFSTPPRHLAIYQAFQLLFIAISIASRQLGGSIDKLSGPSIASRQLVDRSSFFIIFSVELFLDRSSAAASVEAFFARHLTFFVLGHPLHLILLLHLFGSVMRMPERPSWRTFLDKAFVLNAKSSWRTSPTLTYSMSFKVGVGSYLPYFITRVRGTGIAVTPQIVAVVLHVPRVKFPDYPSCECLRTVSKDELKSAFCERPSEWAPPSRSIPSQSAPSTFAPSSSTGDVTLRDIMTQLQHMDARLDTLFSKLYQVNIRVSRIAGWQVVMGGFAPEASPSLPPTASEDEDDDADDAIASEDDDDGDASSSGTDEMFWDSEAAIARFPSNKCGNSDIRIPRNSLESHPALSELTNQKRGICRYHILYSLRLGPPFPNDGKILKPKGFGRVCVRMLLAYAYLKYAYVYSWATYAGLMVPFLCFLCFAMNMHSYVHALMHRCCGAVRSTQSRRTPFQALCAHNDFLLNSNEDIIKLIMSPPNSPLPAQVQWTISLNMAIIIDEIWKSRNLMLF